MRKQTTVRAGQVMAGLLLFALCATAQAYQYLGFDIHGYGSVGYLYSDNNNYLTVDTDGGDFDAYDFGLNIGRDLTPDLRVGAQGVIRKLGSMGKGKPRVDWANIDYRPFDWAGIRLGIVKVPFGLYNEGRDLDMLRTPVFLPQGIYNEQLADFFVGNVGGQIYGNVYAGRAGFFSYTLTLAQVDFASDNPWAVYFAQNVLRNVGLQQAQNPGAFPLDSYDHDNKYHASISAVWDTPVMGLRLGTAYNRLKSDFDINTKNPMLPTLKTEISLERYMSFSAEYTFGMWRAVAEYMTSQFDTTLKMTGDTVPRKSEGYYGQLSYRFNEWLELATYYSVYYPDTDDRSGRQWQQIGQIMQRPDLYPDYLAWQKDLCISARFDINMNWLVKLSYHYMDGVGQLYPSDNPDGFTRNWNFVAVKTTYTF